MDPQMAIRTRKGAKMKHILHIKVQGRLSAQSVVTVRASVTYHLKDEPEPTFFCATLTSFASDVELFLLPYTDDPNAELEVEILNILQPGIDQHDDNLKWLDYLIQRQQDDGLNEFPPGWNEERVQSVITYYEQQTEDEAVAEAEENT